MMKEKTKKPRGFKRLLAMDEDPEYIAKGFALGTFIGMMPIPGFQVLVSLALATIIKVHKPAAIIGVFNTNVATGALFFAFNYWLGKHLLGLSPDFVLPSSIGFDFISAILAAGMDVFYSMLAGGVVTGLVLSVLSYKIVLAILLKRKENA